MQTTESMSGMLEQFFSLPMPTPAQIRRKNRRISQNNAIPSHAGPERSECKPPNPPADENSAAPFLPPPVRRGRAGVGASANDVNCASALPNPPPEYRGRGQAAASAIQKDTPPPANTDEDFGPLDPADFDVVGTLTPRQLHAADLLVSGKNDRETAEAVGVTRVTVTRWRLYHLGFRAAVSRRRKETFGVASDRLRGLLHRAIDVLETQLASEDPKVQMAAIRLMISLSRQCPLQPSDEPESSREILEREAREYRLQRLASIEADQPTESEDCEEAFALLRQRSSTCSSEERTAAGASVIQKDTKSDEVGCASAHADEPGEGGCNLSHAEKAVGVEAINERPNPGEPACAEAHPTNPAPRDTQ